MHCLGFLLRLIDLIVISIVAANALLTVDNMGQSLETHDLAFAGGPVNSSLIYFSAMRKYATLRPATPGATPLSGEWEENPLTKFDGTSISSHSCGQNYPASISVQCDYDARVWYKIAMSVFGGYFFLFLAYRIWNNYRYSYDDYRLYLFVDASNSRWPTICFLAAGVLLSLSVSIALLVLFNSGPKANPGKIWNAILFSIANVIGLLSIESHYTKNCDPEIFDFFPDPIPITELPGGDGILVILRYLGRPGRLYHDLAGVHAEPLDTFDEPGTTKKKGLARLTDRPEDLSRLMFMLKDEELDIAALKMGRSQQGGGEEGVMKTIAVAAVDEPEPTNK